MRSLAPDAIHDRNFAAQTSEPIFNSKHWVAEDPPSEIRVNFEKKYSDCESLETR